MGRDDRIIAINQGVVDSERLSRRFRKVGLCLPFDPTKEDQILGISGKALRSP